LGNRILLNERPSSGSIPVCPTRNVGFSTTPYLSYTRAGQINVSPARKSSCGLPTTAHGEYGNHQAFDQWQPGDPARWRVTRWARSTITCPTRVPNRANSPQTIKLEFNDSATNAIVRQYSFTTSEGDAQGGMLNTVRDTGPLTQKPQGQRRP
jgi:hypothetical protein